MQPAEVIRRHRHIRTPFRRGLMNECVWASPSPTFITVHDSGFQRLTIFFDSVEIRSRRCRCTQESARLRLADYQFHGAFLPWEAPATCHKAA